MSKINTKVMALGSVALFVTASAAMAGVPANPILGLNGHTATNAYDSASGTGVYGISFGVDGGGATFNANGDLTGLADRATCGATNATCKILDGSGDGMLMYMVTDGSGKKHINQIVGSNTSDDGLFLGELFVEYNGGTVGGGGGAGTNVDSMASKYIMKDADELASAGTGFRLSAEWLRGDYQQIQPSSFTAANTPGGGTNRDLDTVIDMNIGGVVSFTATGVQNENGGPANQAGMLVDIQSGTNADNTATDAEDAQAMGVFHTRLQGGNAPYTSTNTNIGNTDYRLGSPTVTLGTGVLAFGANDGVSTTYLHQAGFGFNGNADEDYTVDHPELRDFSYIRISRTNGYPAAVGTPQDPMNGVYGQASTTDGASLTATSQLGSVPMFIAASAVATAGINGASNTVHAPDYNSIMNTATANDIFAAGTGGEFVGTGASNHDTDDIQAAWLAIFGTSAE